MILDTDFLIDLLRNDPEALHFLKELIKRPVDLHVTHVTLWELFQGVFNSSNPEKNLKKTEDLIEFFKVLPFSRAIAKRFGILVNDLKRQGLPIGVMDTLIACVALENNLRVISRNQKHFERTGVSIEEW